MSLFRWRQAASRFKPARMWQAARRFDLVRLWREGHERLRPRWRADFLDSDVLPPKLPARRLVVARDGDELWSVGMLCPCGCREIIELPLIEEADQHWALHVDSRGHASLRPSVWRKTGCRSHFWLRAGRVHWC